MGWNTAVLAAGREMSVALRLSILSNRLRTSSFATSEARKISALRIRILLMVGQIKRAKKHHELMTAAPLRPACTGLRHGVMEARAIPRRVQNATIT
jgi:hypothetical protein